MRYFETQPSAAAPGSHFWAQLLDMDAELARQRDEGVVKALAVTKLVNVVVEKQRECDAALNDIKLLVASLGDRELERACCAVETTLAQLGIMMSQAAAHANVEEFDKISGAINILLTSVRTSRDQAQEELNTKRADADADADADTGADTGEDESIAAAVLLKTKDVADTLVGLPCSRYGFDVARLVEDAIVLVVDGIPRGYDRTRPGDAWVPLSKDPCLCAHVLSGERHVFMSDYLYVSPDGKYRVTIDHTLCRVDKHGKLCKLPGDLKGRCVFRLGGVLIAVCDSGALHLLDLDRAGNWRLVYDKFAIASAAYVHHTLVVVTADKMVLETRIDGDLTCLNEFTTWYTVEGTRRKWGVTAVGTRCPAGMTLSHPDGRTMKVTDTGGVVLAGGNQHEDLILRPGRPNDLHNLEGGFVSLDVHSGAGAGRDSLMHFDYRLFARPYKPGDFTYSWKLLRAPSGPTAQTFYVYNDFAGDSWLGYDRLADEVVIVNAVSADRVAWTITGGDPILKGTHCIASAQ